MSDRKVIHFAHGNGFPSPCYQKVLNYLKKDYDVFCIEKIGHNDDYPITDNWTYLVDELIASIEKQTDNPVIGVGHSMGGVLSFMASVKRPDLFQGIIALDSFLVGKIKLKMLQLAKKTGWIDRLTPAARTKNRRNHWESKEAVRKYLNTRSFFKYFDPDCLNDYIEYGTKKDQDGYYLAFDREREYQIYCTLPDCFSLFRRTNKTRFYSHPPSALIYGRQSEILKALDIRAAKKHYQMRCFDMNGSHMFPLEYPLECAGKIHQIIKEWGMGK